MALLRGFSRVDKEGRIALPINIRREVGLEKGELIEIKVAGANKAQYIVIHKRKQAR